MPPSPLLLQSAVPTALTPLVVLAYLIGTFMSIGGVMLVIKAIWFIAEAQQTLKLIPKLVEDVGAFRHGRRDDMQELHLSLTIIENDVNTIQEHCEIPVRQYPDRRINGIHDRRKPA